MQINRDLGVQYKTAFVLMHKIRESLMAKRDETPLSGEVQVDGAYVNVHVRPQNNPCSMKCRPLRLFMLWLSRLKNWLSWYYQGWFGADYDRTQPCWNAHNGSVFS